MQQRLVLELLRTRFSSAYVHTCSLQLRHWKAGYTADELFSVSGLRGYGRHEDETPICHRLDAGQAADDPKPSITRSITSTMMHALRPGT